MVLQCDAGLNLIYMLSGLAFVKVDSVPSPCLSNWSYTSKQSKQHLLN